MPPRSHLGTSLLLAMFLSLPAEVRCHQGIASCRDTIQLHVYPGWNLLSVPIRPDSTSIRAVFPLAVSSAFIFSSGYQRIDQLPDRKAFWLKFDDHDTLTISGSNYVDENLPVSGAWNMIPGTHLSTSVASVTTTPDSIIRSGFFRYDASGYHSTDTLIPGAGYWLKTDTAGAIIQSRWEDMGLDSERVVTLAFRPDDDGVIFAGSASDFSAGTTGGLFRSTNGGLSWDTLNLRGDIQKIQIDPIHPDTMFVVAGTVFRSFDGGNTWTFSDSGIAQSFEERVRTIAINPGNPAVLYAGTTGPFGGRLYRTTNAGQSWADATSNDTLTYGIEVIRYNPVNSNVMYIGTGWSGELLKSTNGGYSWRATGLPGNGATLMDVVINPLDPAELIVGRYNVPFHRSTDAGATWTRYDDDLPNTVPPWPQLPETTAVGTGVLIDGVNGTYFGVISQGKNGFPYGPGKDQGVYVRCAGDAGWSKIGIWNNPVFQYPGMELSPNSDFFYVGGLGVFRMRYR